MRRWAISVLSPVRVWASRPRAVLLDDGSQVALAVEGGSPDAGPGGDLVEGHRLSGGEQRGAGVLDAFAPVVGAHRFAAHPVWTAWMWASRRSMSRRWRSASLPQPR